jgi:hypothetical protein
MPPTFQQRLAKLLTDYGPRAQIPYLTINALSIVGLYGATKYLTSLPKDADEQRFLSAVRGCDTSKLLSLRETVRKSMSDPVIAENVRKNLIAKGGAIEEFKNDNSVQKDDVMLSDDIALSSMTSINGSSSSSPVSDTTMISTPDTAKKTNIVFDSVTGNTKVNDTVFTPLEREYLIEQTHIWDTFRSATVAVLLFFTLRNVRLKATEKIVHSMFTRRN